MTLNGRVLLRRPRIYQSCSAIEEEEFTLSHCQFNALWLVDFYLSLFFLQEYHSSFMPTFSGTHLGHKEKSWYIHISSVKFIDQNISICE
jgi:hypothetical protein